MSEVIIRSVESMSVPPDEHRAFVSFLQRLMNRRQVGYLRYGPTDRRKKYLTRLEKEVAAYRKTGNAESLYNVAVYAFLETLAPEHKDFHFDNTAKSVTRMERK